MKHEKKLEINGIKTAVSIREGIKPYIVCIHENSFSQKLFLPLWDDPVLKDYGMLTYDLPGHGESDKTEAPDEVYSLPGYAGHLKKLLELLKLDDVVLLGFSLGGHIAYEAAGNSLRTAVKGVCAIGTPPIDNPGDFEKAFVQLPEGASLFAANITDHHCRVIVDSMTSGSGLKADFIEDLKKSDSRAREYLIKSIGEGKSHSEHDFLGKTKIPVLCMFGENDMMINPEYIREERIKNLLGNRLKISKGGDHLPSWSESEEFMLELYSFLEALSA